MVNDSPADRLCRRLIELSRWRSVQALLFAVVLGSALYYATKFRFAEFWPLTPRGDAAIIFNLSERIAAGGRYLKLSSGELSELFPYPPPAVLIFANLASGGPAAAMAIWLGLMGAGLFFSIKASVSGESAGIRGAWLLLGAIAIVVAGQPISWDLRNANSNLIYLGIVMLAYTQLGKRPILAGCCVGLSIAFKLYSGLLLGWLFLFRPKAAIAGLAITLLLWVVWPLATFGFSGAATMYQGWREQLRIVADPTWHAALDDQTAGTQPPVITVRKAVSTLTGAAQEHRATTLLTGALLCAWTGLVCWYLFGAYRAGVSAMPSRGALADWVVLLMAPLPFSPWLEPYHAIALLPAAMLLLAVIFDVGAPRMQRTLAVAGLATVVLLREFVDSFPLRGLSFLAQFAVIVVVLGMMRREISRRIAPVA